MELISREEAKRKITEELDSIDHVPSWVFRRLEKVISSLPTVEEREKGRWEHIDGTGWWNGWYRCSECGEKEKMKGSFQPYCRWCGARMKGE